jgi:hypothetical protein
MKFSYLIANAVLNGSRLGVNVSGTLVPRVRFKDLVSCQFFDKTYFHICSQKRNKSDNTPYIDLALSLQVEYPIIYHPLFLLETEMVSSSDTKL